MNFCPTVPVAPSMATGIFPSMARTLKFSNLGEKLAFTTCFVKKKHPLLSLAPTIILSFSEEMYHCWPRKNSTRMPSPR
jgi:hypothetical protein